MGAEEKQRNAASVRGYIERMYAIAKTCRASVEADLGPLADMTPADRAAALDIIRKQADAGEDFLELVSDILDELRGKFDGVTVLPASMTKQQPAGRGPG